MDNKNNKNMDILYIVGNFSKVSEKQDIIEQGSSEESDYESDSSM